MNEKFFNLLGLCMRAGRLVSGEDGCIKAIRAETAALAILDGSASDNARKALSDACAYRSVPLLETQPDALGRAVGKPNRKAVVITDKGFARALIKAAEE
ncbi:MAG: ribosomal L7Ae/L30e/S12e/Gadd45 family protein [Eubacteriales bacterium]|nr:ribosomal L7Ae/L30e/S12e/Gadd45 family protein [Eubacteriales bacterium]